MDVLLEFSALARLRVDMAWTVQFFRVVSTPHRLHQFIPGHQLCRRLGDAIHIWPVRGYRHVVVPAAAVEAFDGDDRDEGDSDAGEPEPPEEGGGDGDHDSGGDDDSGDDDGDDDGGAAGGPGGPKGKAIIVACVPGGKISYYASGRFRAVCDLSAGTHRGYSASGGVCQCQLSRTSRGSDNESQGRPLGLMAAWLSVGASYPDKPSHGDVFVPLGLNHEKRQKIRDRLMASSSDFRKLADKERKQRAGEASEPTGWC